MKVEQFPRFDDLDQTQGDVVVVLAVLQIQTVVRDEDGPVHRLAAVYLVLPSQETEGEVLGVGGL